MEKFNITTHPKDRFRVIDLLYESGIGFESYGWDNFIVSREQLDIIEGNSIQYQLNP